MNKKRLVGGAVGLIMVLGLILAVRNTEARHRQRKFRGELKESFSGSVLISGTSIDTDEDGVKASLGLFKGKSTLGTVTIEPITEFSPVPKVSTTICNSGLLQFDLVMGRVVTRIESSGDLVFSRFTSGTSCVDPATGTVSVSLEGSIMGGTGRFDGATGSVEVNGTVTTLVSDPAPALHGFGAVTGEATKIIDNPNP